MLWELLFGLLLQAAPLHAAPAITPLAPSAEIPIVDSIAVEAFSPDMAPFRVRFGDQENAYRVMAMFVLPGEAVPVSVSAPPAESSAFTLASAGGEARSAGRDAWTWTAPSRPGLYPIEIRDAAGNEPMTLNVFVMVPYGYLRRGSLNGYRIGSYPLARNPAYARPEGFVEVRPGLEDVAVSPHFTLGQFLCKQAGGPTKYVVLRQPLLQKLEQLLARVNAEGVEASTFHLMSAYRTPFYNRAIGNVTTLSRHHYGDAADIFVDEDGDGRMDDLNHDGRHTLDDAHWLGRVVNETQDAPDFAGLVGGLGMYRPTPEHGAFVHVDVRGFEARWGV